MTPSESSTTSTGSTSKPKSWNRRVSSPNTSSSARGSRSRTPSTTPISGGMSTTKASAGRPALASVFPPPGNADRKGNWRVHPPLTAGRTLSTLPNRARIPQCTLRNHGAPCGTTIQPPASELLPAELAGVDALLDDRCPSLSAGRIPNLQQSAGLRQQRCRGHRHGGEIRCFGGGQLDQRSFHARVPEPLNVVCDRGSRLIGGQVVEVADDVVDHPDLRGFVKRHVSPRVPPPSRDPAPIPCAARKSGGWG